MIHDFCLISLSDLLTPWEKIETRLLEASKADFVICLYNPSSKKRHDYLEKACNLMMEYKAPDTVCGIVGNIGREGESMKVLTLEELKTTKVDMFTTRFLLEIPDEKCGRKNGNSRDIKMCKVIVFAGTKREEKSQNFWTAVRYRDISVWLLSMGSTFCRKVRFWKSPISV